MRVRNSAINSDVPAPATAAPLSAVEESLSRTRQLQPREIEDFTCDLLAGQGFVILGRPSVGADGGADIIIRHSIKEPRLFEETWIVQRGKRSEAAPRRSAQTPECDRRDSSQFWSFPVEYRVAVADGVEWVRSARSPRILYYRGASGVCWLVGPAGFEPATKGL